MQPQEWKSIGKSHVCIGLINIHTNLNDWLANEVDMSKLLRTPLDSILTSRVCINYYMAKSPRNGLLEHYKIVYNKDNCYL